MLVSINKTVIVEGIEAPDEVEVLKNINDTLQDDLYYSTPYKQIGFVSEVLDTDYNPDRIIDKVRPFIKGNPNKDGPSKPFMKLGETRTFTIDEDNALRLENLKQNGLNGMLMGARKLESNPTLLAYIRRNSP